MTKIASINVRSLRSPRSRAALFEFLGSQVFDIILLQECNLEKRLNYENIKKFGKGNATFLGGNENKCVGVVILTSSEWQVSGEDILFPGRLLMVKLRKEALCVWFQLKGRKERTF